MMTGRPTRRAGFTLVELIIALVVLSAVAAAYFPARQAGRVDVLEALRWE